MNRIVLQKRTFFFVFSTMAVFLTASLLLFCFPSPSSSEEIYRFERMWPVLQQPWYFSGFGGLEDITVDKHGNVLIAHGMHDRILKFTADGKFITQWGSSGNNNGQFFWPFNIAVDIDNNVYVSDYGNGRVQKFSSDGKFITAWGRRGSGDGEFNNARKITIDSQGYVYVADTGNGRIQKFTSGGQFIKSWPSNAYGIAIGYNNNIYATGNNCIDVFSPEGLLISKWGEGGNINAIFNNPTGIAVDIGGFIYVVDLNNMIQKFTSEGVLIKRMSFGYGTDQGQFDSPQGLAIDNSGYLYVAQWNNTRIQKFTNNGELVVEWKSWGKKDGEFHYPKGIATDTHGYVYVVDSINRRIQKFTQDGQFLAKWPTSNLLGDGPRGIAIDRNGMIWVANTTGEIARYDSNGNLLLEWGKASYFTGIDVDSNDNVFVSNWSSSTESKLKKFDRNGNLITEWGTNFGEQSINDISLDVNDNVYIIDKWNNKIIKYDNNGIFISDWIAPYPPVSIISTNEKKIKFILQENNSFGIYDDNRQKIGSCESNYGHLPGQILSVGGISIDKDGYMYISDSDADRIQAFKPVTTLSKAKAIIVAGGGPYPGNDLWDATQMSANFAYRTLTYQGFTKENIHYLTSDTQLDLDNNGVADDVAGDATNANLQNAITDWASGAEDVIVYLVDHGDTDSFRMSGNETLSAAQLSSWLNTLQDSITGKVIVVYDACESGSFVWDLMPPPGKSRIIIASTSPGESAYFVTQGSVSFSNYFWTHIFNGVDVKDAFALTRDAIRYTTTYQHPLLDANGNGTANEAEDLTLVQNTYIGSGTVISGNAPVIGTVSPDRTINGKSSEQLYADDVTDADGIAHVWAVIRPPDYNQGGSDNPVQSLPSIDLMPVGNDRYEATYSAFNIPGTYQIAIYARDRIGNTSIPTITTVSVNNPLRRKAIIVAGGSQGDTLWPAIERGVKLSYDALRFQGYVDDDLYLLSPASITGVTKLPVLSTRGNLSYAITNWASVNTEDVALYLIGMGDGGIFNISDTETLSAAELKTWLDTLQETIPGAVTVVYDAPLSGSFLPILKPPSGKERILLSSTGAAQPVNFLSNGNISFSRFFWGGVLNGATLWDAYINAKKAMGFLCTGQTPLLDDNGDGIYTKGDGVIARNYILGFGITLAADDPLIGSVSPPQTITGETSATVWAKDVTTTGTIDKVWAVITSPGGIQIPPAIPVTTQPTVIELTYKPATSRYEGIYSSFSTYGNYDIAIYAMDTDGNISVPSATTITQTLGPDRYETDDIWQQANVIILNDQNPDTNIPGYDKFQTHVFHRAGDEDWVKFHALQGEIYKVSVKNPGPNCDPMISLYGTDGTTFLKGADDLGMGEEEYLEWTCPADGIYYMGIKQGAGSESIYGVGTDYQLMLTIPAGTFAGFLKGTITPAVSDAIITTDAPISAISLPDGMFFTPHIAGTFTLTVQAAGYDTYTTTVTVPELGVASVNVGLEKRTSACTYTLSPTMVSMEGEAGTGSFGVYCGSECTWTAESDVPWITVTSDPTGTGNGVVSYSYTANTGAERQGTITTDGHTYTATQAMRMIIGDVDGDQIMNLRDAILAIQVVSRMTPIQNINKGASVNGDGKIGLPEVIYILQEVAGMRQN